MPADPVLSLPSGRAACGEAAPLACLRVGGGDLSESPLICLEIRHEEEVSLGLT